MDEDDDDQEQFEEDDNYVDSRQYRCCFSIWHAKIGTFVFSTLIFHEIILGTLYLVTRNDVREAVDSDTSEIPPRLLAVLVCRFLQLICCGLNYVGLWLERHEFIVPFAVSQLTLGCFSDISTFVLLLNHAQKHNHFLLLSPHWLNLVLPLIVYVSVVVWLMLTLYRCFTYFRAKRLHEKERRQAAASAKEHLQNESLI
uniref:Uncharacterized protein n=1 Tax=Plectus sambesii TaxID=2011161 RepID=A0A914XTI1_9BILA